MIAQIAGIIPIGIDISGIPILFTAHIFKLSKVSDILSTIGPTNPPIQSNAFFNSSVPNKPNVRNSNTPPRPVISASLKSPVFCHLRNPSIMPLTNDAMIVNGIKTLVIALRISLGLNSDLIAVIKPPLNKLITLFKMPLKNPPSSFFSGFALSEVGAFDVAFAL